MSLAEVMAMGDGELVEFADQVLSIPLSRQLPPKIMRAIIFTAAQGPGFDKKS